MLAVTLGITYIDFMAVLVIWYGDLPDKVFWFTRADTFSLDAAGYLAFICGSALPVIPLLFARIRAAAPPCGSLARS